MAGITWGILPRIIVVEGRELLVVKGIHWATFAGSDKSQHDTSKHRNQAEIAAEQKTEVSGFPYGAHATVQWKPAHSTTQGSLDRQDYECLNLYESGLRLHEASGRPLMSNALALWKPAHSTLTT
eukprot:967690-Pleurochrysis_carterae.AAC.2